MEVRDVTDLIKVPVTRDSVRRSSKVKNFLSLRWILRGYFPKDSLLILNILLS